jgi:hypothetical protein
MYPGSILFVSINEAMKEDAWGELIRKVKDKPETASVDIGIIASINDEDVKRKYLEQFGIRCGYTVVKSDISAAVKQLTSILNNMNAKGRRKFLRLMTDQGTKATVNIPMNGTFVDGTIKDISVVGFSCIFTDNPILKKNNLFRDIQLRLQTHLLKVEGIVFGVRMEGPVPVYVVIFTQRVDPEVRAKIRTYIQSNLQNKLEEELKTL